MFFFFFFQAEDGIRDVAVTGVQTCALPIYYMKDNMAAHVQRLIGVYRAKRDAMLKGLDEVLKGTDATISRPAGGFFLWIRLPSGTDRERLAERAVQARIQYTPGPVFYANGGGENYIR